MTDKEILEKVFKAGVVGSGGAGFPTHVKLGASGVDTYLINGAECEPLLEGDQYLMEMEAERLVAAGKVVAEALGGARLLFGLKKKYTRAIQALEVAGGEVAAIRDFYPLGDEVILIYETLGRIVPEGKIPLNVGVVVNNVETLYNIHAALQDNPVTHTFVSAGGAVANPGLYRAPIGTSADEIIAAAGGVTIDNAIFVDGGPMMGKYRDDLDFSVTKTSKAILALPRQTALAHFEEMPVHQILRQARISCCQCSQCTLACSRHLMGFDIEPHRIMRAMAYGQQQNIKVLKMALLCSECNLCSGLHACPMGLSPRRVNQQIKQALRAEGVRPEFPEREMEPNSLRDYRLLPSGRLKDRLGLKKYDRHAPFRGDLEISRVSIPLRQHIGAPAVPLVSTDERVEAGQLIGRPPEGSLGALIHASISGRVSSADSEIVVIEKV